MVFDENVLLQKSIQIMQVEWLTDIIVLLLLEKQMVLVIDEPLDIEILLIPTMEAMEAMEAEVGVSFISKLYLKELLDM